MIKTHSLTQAELTPGAYDLAFGVCVRPWLFPRSSWRRRGSCWGFKSKTDTVVVSLRELVRRRRVDELKELLGSIELDIDVAKSRRRPSRSG